MKRSIKRLVTCFLIVSAILIHVAKSSESTQGRPNFVYIALEDITPMMGCYGDTYAKTPNFDRLAEEGIIFTRAYSPGPVCSVSRSSIVSGMYPSTIGTINHRSRVELPAFLKLIPEIMRDAGYYTCNNPKLDYNSRKQPWDDSSTTAHWRNRPDKKQPFFAKFDFRETHSGITKVPESRIIEERLNRLKPGDFHDPAEVSIPPYHPDDPEFRRVWARYYDSVTQVDYRAGEIFDQLKEDGLWENTIIFVWSDHGTGLPRAKHTIWEQGTHVPLIVRFPEKYQHLAPSKSGTASDDLVSLMDMGPSVMKMAGIDTPDWMQGRALLCNSDAEKREFVVAVRNRLDTRTEMMRSIRDNRYRYQRNFYPHLPYKPYEHYEFGAPVVQRWVELARAGKLTGDLELMAARFKPLEELYDSENDPFMVHNVADDPEYADVLERMRARLHGWMLETRDLGLIEETQCLLGAMHYGSPWAYGQSLDNYDEILEAAELQLDGFRAISNLREKASSPDANIRYWGVQGLVSASLSGGPEVAEMIKETLRSALDDDSISVRLAAAEGLCNYGDAAEVVPALITGLKSPDDETRTRAVCVIDLLPPEVAAELQPLLEILEAGMGETPVFRRAASVVSGKLNLHRWGMGASGSPQNPLMVVQQTQFIPKAYPSMLRKIGGRILLASSEQDDHPLEDLQDGSVGTFWHNQYRPTRAIPPHYVVFENTEMKPLDGLVYRARSAELRRIKDYTVYVSDDGENWGAPLVSGKLDTTGSQKQRILFPAPNNKKFIKFEVGDAIGGKGNVAIGELDVFVKEY